MYVSLTWRVSFLESERGCAACVVVAFCGGRSLCELLLYSGTATLLCCVLGRTDGRVLSPGQANVIYLTTLVVLCEWWDDY